jgi:predicted peptidase
LSQRGAPGKQTKHVFEGRARLEYLLFLPREYGAGLDLGWPLILYLHGVGERGADVEKVKIDGIPKIIESKPDFPFIVVSPQCPEDTLWWDHHQTLKGMLDEIVAAYAVDAGRMYLTGKSMGGFGTWSLAMAHPDVFAAIAPICGGGVSENVDRLGRLPVWAFHGADDPFVPVEQGRRMVDALRACGGDVKFTVYPGVGHDAWTRTYENAELYQWFLRHSKPTLRLRNCF